MTKVYIVHSSMPYVSMFKELGFDVVKDIAEAGLVCFTGGADVTPELYGDKQHHYTGNDRRRDAEELNIAVQCAAKDIPMVGICRGAQFLNVFSGGRMYQHVDKHAVAAGHSITDVSTGQVVHVSSTHHQMMMPQGDHVLVATSNLGGAREWFDGQVAKRDISKEDIEVVFYPETRCLCFQPHPEFNGAEYEGMKVYFRFLLTEFLEV